MSAARESEPADASAPVSEGALAYALVLAAVESGQDGLLFVGGDAGLLQRLTAMARGFDPELTVCVLPPWDNLPYDRTRPSRAVTGARVAGLTGLARPSTGARLVLTTPEGFLQRVPPRDRLQQRAVRLMVGDALDPDWLRDTLTGFGYRFEEVVDEPGEAAIRGAVIDLFPSDSTTPLRLDLEDGRLAELHSFDIATQRSTGDRQSVTLLPASEAFTVPGEALPARLQALLPEGELETLAAFLPRARLVLSRHAETRMQDWLDLVRDSHTLRKAAAGPEDVALPAPERLYLTREELDAQLAGYRRVTLAVPPADPDLLQPPTTAARVATLVRRQLSANRAVLLCSAQDPASWRMRLQRRLRREIAELADWRAAQALPVGQVGVLRLPLSEGFALSHRALVPVGQGDDSPRAGRAVFDRLLSELRIGDLVVDPEHGLARLTGLAMLGDDPARTECLVLGFAGDSRLLVPALEAGRVWRYGADASVKPDRLEGERWIARRQQVEDEIEASAAAVQQQVRARQAATAPSIVAGADYQRFTRRVPFALSADQGRAIDAVLEDLARGRPMHRLVCGDVGYGKTEVALHATAAAALAGFQVAVAAPTTLLAAQHLAVFRARLEPLGLKVEPLIRSARSAAGRETLRGLAEGSIDVVIGTHAVAARQVRFDRLGLVVIDEEQRFGEAQKRSLRGLQHAVHTLVMTATPLPRSLQAALVGLVEVSLLATPPASRSPVRSFCLPFDPVVVRTALRREARRGGQSFVVCPRIEDIAPMRDRLRELVPELAVTAVHGRMRGEALDKAMLDFAEGRGDVLLATNIIEAGLDLPNANTMLVWRPDRFGLAQLHQLRGRVGRGRSRGFAYLLTDPAQRLAAGARKRLDTLVALDDRGAGFAISAADLDLRGAGDLLGEQQAGHLRLLGTELYRDQLVRALQRARGERVAAAWTPEIAFDVPAFVPDDFVPEPDLRLEIYRRLAGLHDEAAVAETADELADRFGELPSPVLALLQLTRLRLACERLEIAQLQAGPRGVALRPRNGRPPAIEGGRWTGERLVLELAHPDGTKRLEAVIALLGEAG